MAVPKVKVGKINPDNVEAVREGYEYGAVCECGYFSIGWPMKKQAQLRAAAHKKEHETGELMPDRADVEALTPEKFEQTNTAPLPENPLWDEVQ